MYHTLVEVNAANPIEERQSGDIEITNGGSKNLPRPGPPSVTVAIMPLITLLKCVDKLKRHRRAPGCGPGCQGPRSAPGDNHDSSFLSVDEIENIIPKIPEAALVGTQAFLSINHVASTWRW
jgi:hypothetical protein